MTSSRSSRSSSPASDGSRSRSPSRSRSGSPERSLATSDEDDDREVQRRIALAAPEGRIPRRDEFRNAIQEVPAPPRIPLVSNESEWPSRRKAEPDLINGQQESIFLGVTVPP
ncbi:hypothetical protein Aduo_011078 [Ancylostoma duodenale]